MHPIATAHNTSTDLQQLHKPPMMTAVRGDVTIVSSTTTHLPIDLTFTEGTGSGHSMTAGDQLVEDIDSLGASSEVTAEVTADSDSVDVAPAADLPAATGATVRKTADLTNAENYQPYRPNRRRTLTKPEKHTYMKKLFG